MLLLHWPQILAGIFIGILMSAPIGPVNFLSFHRTLHRGLLAGWMVGAGAALGDAIFAVAAVSGIKFASAFIEENLGLLQLVGGLLIIGFGIYLLRHKPAKNATLKGKQKIWRGFLSGFALTITNPGNFFGFIAMFSGLTDIITQEESFFHGFSLVVGVMTGALAWWSFFAALTYRFRSKMTQSLLMRINRIAGILILAAGFLLIGRYAIDFLPVFTGA
ncbi:MAG: LysE family transporter [Pseudomonadota bacterium]